MPSRNLAPDMTPSRRWLAVIGSAGQPRDGNPRAAYAIVDQNKNEICCLIKINMKYMFF